MYLSLQHQREVLGNETALDLLYARRAELLEQYESLQGELRGLNTKQEQEELFCWIQRLRLFLDEVARDIMCHRVAIASALLEAAGASAQHGRQN